MRDRSTDDTRPYDNRVRGLRHCGHCTAANGRGVRARNDRPTPTVTRTASASQAGRNECATSAMRPKNGASENPSRTTLKPVPSDDPVERRGAIAVTKLM